MKCKHPDDKVMVSGIGMMVYQEWCSVCKKVLFLDKKGIKREMERLESDIYDFQSEIKSSRSEIRKLNKMLATKNSKTK